MKNMYIYFQVSFIHVSPKMEYQSNYGVEQLTVGEVSKDWASAYVRPNCKIIRGMSDRTVNYQRYTFLLTLNCDKREKNILFSLKFEFILIFFVQAPMNDFYSSTTQFFLS